MPIRCLDGNLLVGSRRCAKPSGRGLSHRDVLDVSSWELAVGTAGPPGQVQPRKPVADCLPSTTPPASRCPGPTQQRCTPHPHADLQGCCSGLVVGWWDGCFGGDIPVNDVRSRETKNVIDLRAPSSHQSAKCISKRSSADVAYDPCPSAKAFFEPPLNPDPLPPSSFRHWTLFI